MFAVRMISTTARRQLPELDGLCRLMAREDRCTLSGHEVEALLRRRSPDALADWDEFRASWSRMPIDGYMADGGRYRRRRYAVLSAEPGSVEVERFLEVERYSHVTHLVSQIAGDLRDGAAQCQPQPDHQPRRTAPRRS